MLIFYTSFLLHSGSGAGGGGELQPGQVGSLSLDYPDPSDCSLITELDYCRGGPQRRKTIRTQGQHRVSTSPHPRVDTDDGSEAGELRGPARTQAGHADSRRGAQTHDLQLTFSRPLQHSVAWEMTFQLQNYSKCDTNCDLKSPKENNNNHKVQPRQQIPRGDKAIMDFIEMLQEAAASFVACWLWTNNSSLPAKKGWFFLFVFLLNCSD